MPASPAYLAQLRAAMNPSAQYPDGPTDVDQAPSLVGQPLPPGFDPSATPDNEVATHPMLDFAIGPDGYDALSKDQNDRALSEGEAIDTANNAILARQKDAAVQAKSDSVLADDARRRADLRTNLIRAGNKNPEAEVSRLMGPAPTPQTIENVKSAIATGDAGVVATPSGVQSGIDTGRANLSKGEAPKPAPTEKAKPEGDLSFYQPTQPPQSKVDNFQLPLNGGGGSVKVAPSAPYHLPAALESAFSDERRAMEDQADAASLSNAAIQGGHNAVADLIKVQAAEDAGRARAEAEEAKQMQRSIDDQSKKLADVKIDPSRYFSNASILQKALFAVAAGLGGLANPHGPNQTIELQKKLIDDDISAQRQEIESGKHRLEDMKGGLAEFYKRTHNMDQSVALAQAKGMEVLKHQQDSLVAGSNDALIRANAKRNLAQYDAQLEQYKMNAAAADAEAKRKAAAAAGGGNSQKLAEYTMKLMGEGKDPVEAQRMAAFALRMVGPDAVEGSTGVHKGGKGSAEEKQHGNDKFNEQLQEMIESGTVQKDSLIAGALSLLGPRVAPESTAYAQNIKEVNTSLINAIGHAARDAEGKPSKTMMDLYEGRFDLHPGDPPATKIQKLRGAANVVNRLEAQQGAVTPSTAVGGRSVAPSSFKE